MDLLSGLWWNRKKSLSGTLKCSRADNSISTGLRQRVATAGLLGSRCAPATPPTDRGVPPFTPLVIYLCSDKAMLKQLRNVELGMISTAIQSSQQRSCWRVETAASCRRCQLHIEVPLRTLTHLPCLSAAQCVTCNEATGCDKKLGWRRWVRITCTN